MNWDPDELRRMYVDQRMTCAEIADQLGCAHQTISKKLKAFGIPSRRVGPKSGHEHPGWKGGITVDKAGYILVYRPNHPNCNSNGYIRHHRLVMEEILGRYLTEKEVVHHKDGDPSNNDPENLKLFATNGHHLAETLAGKCPNWTEEGRQRILDANLRKGKKRRKLKSTSRKK